ncbi:MAG: hypothetical protein WC685_10105 [Methylobacter sp.]|jgi:hypothetical protein
MQTVNFNGILNKAMTGNNQQLAISQAEGAQVNFILTLKVSVTTVAQSRQVLAYKTNDLHVFSGPVHAVMINKA